MDNFRVARPAPQASRPQRSVDGFITHTPKTKAPYAGGRLVITEMAPVRPVAKPVTPSAPAVSSYVEPIPVVVEQAPALPSLPNLDLNLNDNASEKGKNRLSAGRKFRKWLLRGGIATFVLLLGVGGLLFAQGYGKVHKVFKGTAAHAVSLQSNVDPTLLKGEGDGRVNILLLGNGGDGHDGPDLTDTMMIASIDPVNKTASLLSVPRDLWVKMPNSFVGANQKINAAYEAGKYKFLGKIDSSNANSKSVEAGFASADQVVGEVLGIPIHYNLLVDFQAFRQGVDSVGGVTVNVPEQLYDPTMAWENHNNPILAAAGAQQMDGVHALMYVRSRETSSDFARGERQRSVILALKQKALSLGTLSNPVKISSLLSAFGNNMVTDLSLSDAARLYDLTKGIADTKIQSLDLVTKPNNLVTTGNLSGISIDQPRAGLNNYGEIQTYVRSQLKDGYLTKENSPIALLNGTPQPGLATTKATELQSYGYNIASTANAPTQQYAKTVVVDLTNGADKYTKHYLETRYNTTVVTQLPDATIKSNGAHFVIILGSDQY